MNGLCRCGRARVSGFRSCQPCLDGYRKYTSLRNSKRKASGLCAHCGRQLIGGFSKCEKCRAIAVNHLQRLKAEIIANYGGMCACCGETEPSFLTIDHTNDDGSAHRKAIGSNRVYSWLKRNGFPKDGFSLLCFNCNCGRRVNGGTCPHKSRDP